MRRAVLVLAVVVAGFAALIRLAPVDPARFHVAVEKGAPLDCTLQRGTGDAIAACLTGLPPVAALQRLAEIARTTPRTRLVAGSPDSGRMTWETRSLVWGFPDYTTAEASVVPEGTRIDLHARLRFGVSDLGVNAARIGDWSARLMAGGA